MLRTQATADGTKHALGAAASALMEQILRQLRQLWLPAKTRGWASVNDAVQLGKVRIRSPGRRL